MIESTSEGNDPHASNFEGTPEFEQPLRELASFAAPSTQRRDRLMYDSGYAAALAEFEAKSQSETTQTRRSLSRSKFLSLAMSMLLVVSLGLHVLNSPATPSSMAVSHETIDKPTPRATEPPRPIWPGMKPALAQEKSDIEDSYRIVSVRSQSLENDPAPRPTVVPLDTPPSISVEPRLRATDYHRLLDRT